MVRWRGGGGGRAGGRAGGGSRCLTRCLLTRCLFVCLLHSCACVNRGWFVGLFGICGCCLGRKQNQTTGQRWAERVTPGASLGPERVRRTYTCFNSVLYSYFTRTLHVLILLDLFFSLWYDSGRSMSPTRRTGGGYDYESSRNRTSSRESSRGTSRGTSGGSSARGAGRDY
jgi:hypothetical protein